VYALPRGAIVLDALEAAGGALDAAALQAVNLAEPLQDGTKLCLPRADEETTPGQSSIQQIPTRKAEDQNRININSAGAPELETLPGIGPALAEKIIEYRERHGPFETAEDLMKVSGIGPATMERLIDLIETD
jgi:competence protein ComEA